MNLRLMFLLAGLVLAASCQQHQTCLEKGTCECLGAVDCPPGLDCVGGKCRSLTPPEPPRFGFGQNCNQDSQCLSGYCLPRGPGNGGVCTRSCASEPCPEGWECKMDAAGAQALCVQKIPARLCLPCGDDRQCNALGDLCLEMAGQKFCALDCSFASCPAGTRCQPVPAAGSTAWQCLPESLSCACNPSNLGLTRPCQRTGVYGSCVGQQTCLLIDGLATWSECNAREAAPEVCNGLDDDCDGLLDQLDPDIDTSSLSAEPPYPACRSQAGAGCVGEWQCLAGPEGFYDWVCGATTSREEICNGLDDDCNGRVDDPFTDEAGRYLHPHHCGGCGGDCFLALEHLATDEQGEPLPGSATCQLREGTTVCVPMLCQKGYWPYPPQSPLVCAPLVSPACRPCSQSDDCLVPSDICSQPDPVEGEFCLQSCSPFSPYADCHGQQGERDCCPEGYSCQEWEGGWFCLPDGGSCNCNAARLGATRPCLLFGPGGEMCQGKQTCAEDGELFSWSECLPAEISLEVCDGLDNNCDGQVDEGFVDAEGRYFTDHHCAQCNQDCTARWSRQWQHAIGGCVLDGGSPQCRITSCLSEWLPAYGPCRADVDCPAGAYCAEFGHCLPQPTSCPGPNCGRSCSSDAECRDWFGSAYACRQQLCQLELQYQNANRQDHDGCECAVVRASPQDEPDIPSRVPVLGERYIDGNCDGIDGDAARALFVRAGSASSQGTRQNPYATIGEALAAFDPSRHSHILVASGLYQEQVVLKAGVGLYGGYSADFYHRDIVGQPTIIRGSEPMASSRPGTIYAENLFGQKTTVSGFFIYGYDVHRTAAAGQPGESTYAVYLKDCQSALQLQGNFIFAGRAGAGGDGAGGAGGANGAAGAPGRDSRECHSSDCRGESQSGGAGGVNASCPVAAGTPGATARPYCYNASCTQDYQASATNGRGGSDSAYTDSHDPALCKYDCQVSSSTIPSNGEDAASGQNGSGGFAGVGCALGAGRVENGRFLAYSGDSGSAGQSGTGGGGGGAGGAVINYNTSPPCYIGQPLGDLGASGGGGGAGGCGGGGGAGGGGGGGSFAIFLYYTSTPSSFPVIRANFVTLGAGGRGGDGGGGGLGGLGGPGGRGGQALLPAWCAGAGGSGGRGGNGGAGGGGGGGCGGVSVGLASNQVDDPQNPFFRDNEFYRPPAASGGPGGAGGPSPGGQSGLPGAAGAMSSTWVY